MRSKHLTLSLYLAGVLVLAFVPCVSALAGPPPSRCDLDVAYISRTPRYDRYNVTWVNGYDPRDWGNGRPFLFGDESSKQRWPAAGETVTFTAVVKNPGKANAPASSYKWYFDGVQVAAGTFPSIPIGGQATATYSWTWDSEWNDHNIKFVVDPANSITEEIETNNTREDRTNALAFRLHVWQSVYDWMHDNGKVQNRYLASFDDWAQMQVGYINKMFAEAVYPSCPNGILERVRLDEVVVEPDTAVDQDPGACHAPDNWGWDCRWGFTPNEYPQIWIEHPEFVGGPYNWVIHEWGHQLGLIDVYRFSMGLDQNHIVALGHPSSRDFTLMIDNSLNYDDHSATAINFKLHKRQGYFGEYLYDVPQTCKIRLLDAYHRPIANASVKFYQDTGHQFNAPEDFTLTTDSAGYATLPNRSCYGSITTGTGHTLHDNPWQQIYVVGFNGIFLCEATVSGQTDYQFMEILPFNVAYRAGYTDSYTYDLQTTILPGGRPTTNNLYGIRMVSQTCGYAVGDAGTILQWDGSSWTGVSNPATYPLRAVDASKSGDRVLVVGDRGTTLVYSNGTWAQKNLSTTNALRTCCVVSADVMFVGGDNGDLFKSTNGGQNWTRITATSGVIRSICFADATHGLFTSDGGKVYYTTDAGDHWTLGTGIIATANLTHCALPTATEAWACNNDGDVFRSNDGGATWSVAIDLGPSEDWNSVAMTPGGSGWVVGGINEYNNSANIIRLENGKIWRETITVQGASDTVYDISCLSSGDAWAVGNNGLLLHLSADNIASYSKGTAMDMTAKSDGTPVVMTGTAVSGSFPGSVYVESTDRSTGFRALTNQSILPGALVQVSGILDTDGIERLIRYADVTSVGTTTLKPVGVTTKAMKADTTEPGLSTAAILVKVAGKVTGRGSNWFTVDDGAGKVDSEGNKGVKVTVPSNVTVPDEETYVRVTGVSSVEKVSGKSYPLIKVRKPEDIQ